MLGRAALRRPIEITTSGPTGRLRHIPTTILIRRQVMAIHLQPMDIIHHPTATLHPMAIRPMATPRQAMSHAPRVAWKQAGTDSHNEMP